MSIIKKQLHIVLLWYRLARKHFTRIYHEITSLIRSFFCKEFRPKEPAFYAEIKIVEILHEKLGIAVHAICVVSATYSLIRTCYHICKSRAQLIPFDNIYITGSYRNLAGPVLKNCVINYTINM